MGWGEERKRKKGEIGKYSFQDNEKETGKQTNTSVHTPQRVGQTHTQTERDALTNFSWVENHLGRTLAVVLRQTF